MDHILKNKELLTIRRAARSDAEKLIRFVNTIGGESDFLTFGRDEFNMTAEQEEVFLEAVSSRDNSVYLVAETKEKLVGLVSFAGGARQRTAHTGEMSLSVLRDYWGMGVGTALMEALFTWARGTGIIRKINLRVRTDNTRAVSLYKKLGFRETGTVTREMMIDGVFYDNFCMGYDID
jgi:RimJ/RimL family protein N-acetyltransferase